jgi:hypothetical protein
VAKEPKTTRAAKRTDPKALHLTASMRVLRFHYARPALTVADAQRLVKELALRVGTGDPTRDDVLLEQKLRKATGAGIAELADAAEHWPDV